jgi:glycine/D-amino acid oxidase-like deaminating enzyme
MGFTAAPAVSEALADLALGLAPALDLSGFCLESGRSMPRAVP